MNRQTRITCSCGLSDFHNEKIGPITFAVCVCGKKKFVSRDLDEKSKMFYGKKHRDKKLRDVPWSYLEWIYENDPNLPVPLKAYIEKRKQRISNHEFLAR
jgi:hypothetical protein